MTRRLVHAHSYGTGYVALQNEAIAHGIVEQGDVGVGGVYPLDQIGYGVVLDVVLDSDGARALPDEEDTLLHRTGGVAVDGEHVYIEISKIGVLDLGLQIHRTKALTAGYRRFLHQFPVGVGWIFRHGLGNGRGSGDLLPKIGVDVGHLVDVVVVGRC